MAPTQAKQWQLSSRTSDLPTYTGTNANLRLKTVDLPKLGPNQVLLKTLYLSNGELPSTRCSRVLFSAVWLMVAVDRIQILLSGGG
jgi:NADPH-dependent curcumin reductase CurA